MNLRYWIVLALFAVLIYSVRSVLPPFVIAAVLAYVFVPGIDAVCTRFNWPRTVRDAGVRPTR